MPELDREYEDMWEDEPFEVPEWLERLESRPRVTDELPVPVDDEYREAA